MPGVEIAWHGSFSEDGCYFLSSSWAEEKRRGMENGGVGEETDEDMETRKWGEFGRIYIVFFFNVIQPDRNCMVLFNGASIDESGIELPTQ